MVLPIQCGRSLVLLKTVPSFNFLRCCGCEKELKVMDYQLANHQYIKQLSHYRNLKVNLY